MIRRLFSKTRDQTEIDVEANEENGSDQVATPIDKDDCCQLLKEDAKITWEQMKEDHACIAWSHDHFTFASFTFRYLLLTLLDVITDVYSAYAFFR